MIKINYPKDKKKFESDYLEIFTLDEEKWNNLIKDMHCSTKKVLKKRNVIKAKDLLTLPFTDSLDIYKSFVKSEHPLKKIKNKKSKYQEIFDYDTLQPKIAIFFNQNNKDMKLKTCYFCNIDYINVFDTDILALIKEENYDELMNYEIFKNNKHIERIKKYQEKVKIGEYKDLLNIDYIDKKVILKIKQQSLRNHFTLDHFLPKAKCPILALSLYNLVPSCYACNSKFKREEELLETYLSPTSDDFSVDTDIKFKLFVEGELSDKKFKLKLTHSDISKEYINTFKLKGRYAFHKDIAKEIIEKQEKYSESQIKEMADILKISSEQIKKDIFGKELFVDGKVQEKSFTKLKRDIFNQGIL